MKFGLGGLMKAMTIGAEFTTLQAVTYAVNQMQNIPPIARFIANASLQFASYELVKKSLTNLPPSVKGIAGIAMKMQIIIAGVQMIPSIMQMITSMTGGGNPYSTQPMGGSPYGMAAPQGFAPLPLA